LIDHKRRSKAGDDDLLAALVGVDGGLSEEELVSTAYLLLLVGHDTTVGLIGNGMLALIRHPDQLHRLRTEEALMPSAIDELMRYDSPVRDATFRVAREPIELHGCVIQPGEIVSLLIGSANRDGRKFPEPDRLDLGRTPNDHLAFGRGPHFCIGAALVRMEGAIAFRMLLERLGDVRLALRASQLPWRPSRVMRSLEQLPVVRG
jgi:cytochrome P450